MTAEKLAEMPGPAAFAGAMAQSATASGAHRRQSRALTRLKNMISTPLDY
jgi:hypothetical protein